MQYTITNKEKIPVFLTNYLKNLNIKNPSINYNSPIIITLVKYQNNFSINVNKDIIDEVKEFAFNYSLTLIPNYYVDPSDNNHIEHLQKASIQFLQKYIHDNPCEFVDDQLMISFENVIIRKEN